MIDNNFSLQSNKTILISGGGPAGLFCALHAIKSGCQPIVIEKREEFAKRRLNTIALNYTATQHLKEEGIYQYLIENRLIFSSNVQGGISVRLKDLEDAMKYKIATLSAPPVIQYGKKIKKILFQGNNQRVGIILRNISGGEELISKVDLVINAEGSHSTTNQLLKNPRIEVLPKIPVISAIFQDDRSKITGASSFFSYVGKTVSHLATATYRYATFFLKAILAHEYFSNSKRNVKGGIILKTPHQNYVGLALSNKENLKLLDLKHKVHQSKGKSKEEFEKAENELRQYVNYWANIAFCEVNCMAAIGKLLCLKNKNFECTSWKPLKDFSVFEIGADQATFSALREAQSAFLVIGDALVTVDPASGEGCNAAINCSYFAEAVIQGIKENRNLDELLKNYNEDCSVIIEMIHKSSKRTRTLYQN